MKGSKTVKGKDLKKHEDVRGMRNSTAATGRSLDLHFRPDMPSYVCLN